MTLENTNFGSEYGVDLRRPGVMEWNWTPILLKPGLGFKTYEEAYQTALEKAKEQIASCFFSAQLRVVVYDYKGLKRKNIRTLTIIDAKG